MKLILRFIAFIAFVGLSGVTARASTIDSYSFSVTVMGGVLFSGQTYTGTFKADEQTGHVTDFSANLLGANIAYSDLGNVAQITGGVVSNLHFGLHIQAIDGDHSAAFTSGFDGGIIGLDPNNYFAFLTSDGYLEGAGVPVFTQLTAVTPEPSSFVLLGSGILGLGAVLRRRLS